MPGHLRPPRRRITVSIASLVMLGLAGCGGATEQVAMTETSRGDAGVGDGASTTTLAGAPSTTAGAGSVTTTRSGSVITTSSGSVTTAGSGATPTSAGAGRPPTTLRPEDPPPRRTTTTAAKKKVPGLPPGPSDPDTIVRNEWYLALESPDPAKCGSIRDAAGGPDPFTSSLIYLAAAEACLGHWAEAEAAFAQWNTKSGGDTVNCGRRYVVAFVQALLAAHEADPSFKPAFSVAPAAAPCQP